MTGILAVLVLFAAGQAFAAAVTVEAVISRPGWSADPARLESALRAAGLLRR